MAKLGRPRTCECGECRKCKQADYMRGWWRGKSLEEKRAHIAKRDPERVKAQERKRQYHPDRVERRRIITQVHNALRDGRLTREPCEVCGAGRAEAHHDDYSKPLEVRWLCKQHHTEHHIMESESLRAA